MLHGALIDRAVGIADRTDRTNRAKHINANEKSLVWLLAPTCDEGLIRQQVGIPLADDRPRALVHHDRAALHCIVGEEARYSPPPLVEHTAVVKSQWRGTKAPETQKQQRKDEVAVVCVRALHNNGGGAVAIE